MAQDDGRAVAAFARLRLIRTERWPMVAAWLLDSGFEGPALEQMASLDSHADAWDVEPLRDDVLTEINAADLDDQRAALLVGGTFGRTLGTLDPGHGVVRRLAALAPSLDYPSGLIGDCYHVEEFLDCDCHPDGNQEADRLELKLRTELTLDLNPGLAAALIAAI